LPKGTRLQLVEDDGTNGPLFVDEDDNKFWVYLSDVIRAGKNKKLIKALKKAIKLIEDFE